MARSVALHGLARTIVTVEAHVGIGLPGFSLLGGRGSVFGQAGERVRSALAAVNLPVTQKKVVVNLAPADVIKQGARFDLAIALAVLRAMGEARPGEQIVMGEVALDGAIRPVTGVLPSLRSVPEAIVATRNAAEARLARVGSVTAVSTVRHLLDVLDGKAAAAEVPPPPAPRIEEAPEDLADVVGQPEARRAVEVAAAGAHHLLLLGPPGAGKSMLARRLPGLLPDLSDEEALTVASIRSLTGRGGTLSRLDRRPPFAAPHHSSSAAAILGGGTGMAKPGAVSEATHGVLFLDELFEWQARTLDGLREPLEDGQVRIARSAGSVAYPASVLLVAASNPCPCGPARTGCRCRLDHVARYRARLTGPLADRFDLAPTIDAVPPGALAAARTGEPTAVVRARVEQARTRSLDRFGCLNAVAPALDVRRTATRAALAVLVEAAAVGRLSARGFDRALRVARTCADLAGNDLITDDDAQEAVAHRANLDAIWDHEAA